MSRALVGILLFLGITACFSDKEVGGIQATIKLEEKPREIAFKMCACITEEGLNSVATWGLALANNKTLEANISKAKKCVKTILDEYLDLLKDLEPEKQREFIKQVLHSLVESSCVSDILDVIPEYYIENYL